MFVYVVTATDIDESFMTGVYATVDAANIERARLEAIDSNYVVNITETELIGYVAPVVSARSSWEGEVDRQGGSFSNREILNSTEWH